MVALTIFLGTRHIGGVQLDVGTLLVACMTVIIGVQLTAFAFFAKVFAIGENLLPDSPRFRGLFRRFTLERGVVAGTSLLLGGTGLLGWSLWLWGSAGFGHLDYAENLRRLIGATTLLILGVQIIFSSFFMSVLGLKTTSRRPPGTENQ